MPSAAPGHLQHAEDEHNRGDDKRRTVTKSITRRRREASGDINGRGTMITSVRPVVMSASGPIARKRGRSPARTNRVYAAPVDPATCPYAETERRPERDEEIGAGNSQDNKPPRPYRVHHQRRRRHEPPRPSVSSPTTTSSSTPVCGRAGAHATASALRRRRKTSITATISTPSLQYHIKRHSNGTNQDEPQGQGLPTFPGRPGRCR